MEISKSQEFSFLIADDDPDDQYALQAAIWNNNPQHKITAVYNGMQLLEYLMRKGPYKNSKEPAPHCVFLDLNMPLLTGELVLKKIMDTKQLCNLPVYMLSSSVTAKQETEFLKLGARGCYIKEPEVRTLKKMIKDVVHCLNMQTLANK